MIDRLETIIKDWLSTEFKNQDAMPKLMVKSLAEEINKHRWEIYEHVKDEYDLEDIRIAAGENNVELTQKEEDHALHRYRKAQEYEPLMVVLDEIIQEIVENRKDVIKQK